MEGGWLLNGLIFSKYGDRREVFSCFSSHESRITGNVPSVPKFPKFRPQVSKKHIRAAKKLTARQ